MVIGLLNVPVYLLSISQGKTKKEAIVNIQEAIELYLEVLQEECRAIPKDQVETVTKNLQK